MDLIEATKFATAEEAWLWTMRVLQGRRAGEAPGSNRAGVIRPCEPDDVVRVLDTVYRQRRIDLPHARVLRIWGERQAAPSPQYPSERAAHVLWTEALRRLEPQPRAKGIVA